MEIAFNLIKIVFGILLFDIIWAPIGIFLLSLMSLSRKLVFQKVIFNFERIFHWTTKALIISVVCDVTGMFETWYWRVISAFAVNLFLINQQFAIEYNNRKRSKNSEKSIFLQNHVIEIEKGKFYISVLGILSILILIIFGISIKFTLVNSLIDKYLSMYDYVWLKITISVVTAVAFTNILLTSIKAKSQRV